MPKQLEDALVPIMISIPDDLKSLVEPIQDLVARAERAVARGRDGRAVNYSVIEEELAEGAAAVERGAHQSVLAGLDIDAPQVTVDGQVFTRVLRSEGRYYTMAGDVALERSLFRAERNGTVVDTISLRTGAVDGWLPATAKAMAYLLAQGTSREAENTVRQLHRLPYSRSSIERVGHLVGELYASRKTDIDDALIVAFAVPAAARAVSFAVDRISLPMEEPRPRPVGRPRRKAPKRPVSRVYRMAYCATMTFHDAEGEALHTIRYGDVPGAVVADLCDRMLADALSVLHERPDLEVLLLSDGAPEMRNILRAALNEETLGKQVHELLDLWHLLEKLAGAALVMYGEAQVKPVMAEWRMALLNRSRAPDDLLAELRGSKKRDVRVGQKAPVHEAITYIENHRDLLGYPAARRRGLPIGSGAVEATCKSLFAVRMKRSGARWKEKTARNVINLRALALSDRWDHAIQLTLAPLRKPVRRAA